MIRLWCTQVLAIIRLEMKKTFFAKRGLWVYLLAFAPLVLFISHPSPWGTTGTISRAWPRTIRSPARPSATSGPG